jgi:hypothetical protein
MADPEGVATVAAALFVFLDESDNPRRRAFSKATAS